MWLGGQLNRSSSRSTRSARTAVHCVAVRQRERRCAVIAGRDLAHRHCMTCDAMPPSRPRCRGQGMPVRGNRCVASSLTRSLMPREVLTKDRALTMSFDCDDRAVLVWRNKDRMGTATWWLRANVVR